MGASSTLCTSSVPPAAASSAASQWATPASPALDVSAVLLQAGPSAVLSEMALSLAWPAFRLRLQLRLGLRRVCAACARPSVAAPFRPVRHGAAPMCAASSAGAHPSAATPFRPVRLGAAPRVCDRTCSRARPTPTKRCPPRGQAAPTAHPMSHPPLPSGQPASGPLQPLLHRMCLLCFCRPAPGHSPQRHGAFSCLPFAFAFAFDFALGCGLPVLLALVPMALAMGTARAVDGDLAWAAWPC